MTLVMLVAQVVVALLLVAGSVLVLVLVRSLESVPASLARPHARAVAPPARASTSEELRRAA